jgi:MoaA/NifB/PqqE/SkfB family radical SAM enzyme
MSPTAPSSMRYERALLRVYWETTRACNLACRHCRARAEPDPKPGKLTFAEGRDLLARLAAFGAPHPARRVACRVGVVIVAGKEK